MACMKDKTMCGRCMIGMSNWSMATGKYMSVFPTCVDQNSFPPSSPFFNNHKLTIDDICSNFLLSSEDKSAFIVPKDTYEDIFPGKIVFGYVLNDAGFPIQVLHGNSAVYYVNGKRVEKPVVFIVADDWADAVAKILRGENGHGRQR